jgi:hypothetical protein
MELIGELRRARAAKDNKSEFDAAKVNILRQFNALQSLFDYVGNDAIDKHGVTHKDALAGGFPSRSIISVEDVKNSPDGKSVSNNPD